MKRFEPIWGSNEPTRTKDTDYVHLCDLYLLGTDIAGPDGIGRLTIGNTRLIFTDRDQVIISSFHHFAEMPEWWTGKPMTEIQP